jgi:hypothetical protein
LWNEINVVKPENLRKGISACFISEFGCRLTHGGEHYLRAAGEDLELGRVTLTRIQDCSHVLRQI